MGLLTGEEEADHRMGFALLINGRKSSRGKSGAKTEKREYLGKEKKAMG
jgi:hypothetical protein